MSKVLPFATHFLQDHPKAGRPTHFIESIYAAVGTFNDFEYNRIPAYQNFCYNPFPDDFKPKWHTIRRGHRFKAGEKFSPRYWSGSPYRSKPVIVGPDITIDHVQDIAILVCSPNHIRIMIDGNCLYHKTFNEEINTDALIQLAANDGLGLDDFKAWFKWGKNDFDGQIICWNPDIWY